MSDDCISRQAALGCCRNEWEEEVEERLKSLPPVTPNQKMGRWIWQTEDIYRCSECGEDVHVKEVMNVPQYEFCPNCGAKMESEDKE